MGSRKRRRTEPADVAQPEREAVQADAPAAAVPARPPLSRRRTWLYRLLALTLVPTLFFMLLEAALRVGGYGYPTGFLVPVAGRDSYTTNAQFGWRFFPSQLARTPAICEIPVEKPADTFRIVVLGSSAAMGTPDPAYGLGRWLQVMLEERFPERRFEVVNAAMTAVNSHVVLPIARDCRPLRPDLVVVYMGNNEFVGPYGPGTVFRGFTASRRLIRASIAIRGARTGQLLDALFGSLAAQAEEPAEWKGLEMFLGNLVPPDDPRLAAVYDNFLANLRDIVSTAHGTGAPVLLCTVAVNLGDCAPFASAHRAELDDDALAAWEKAYDEGIRLAGSDRPAEAVRSFHAALEIDDCFAELHFRLAQCHVALGAHAAAREHFALARDCDALRFRADTTINTAIREVAETAAGVTLVDVERTLADSPLAPHGIPGETLFYEHVHLTPEGNHALAAAVYASVVEVLAADTQADRAAAAPAFDACRRRLALTAWDRYRLMREMAAMQARAPFTDQFDHAERTARQQRTLDKLEGACAGRDVLGEAQREYEAAIKRSPEDLYLRVNFAGLLHHRRAFASAVEQMQTALARFPDVLAWRCRLAALLEAQGKWKEAGAELRKTATKTPQQAAAVCFNEGTMLMDSGKHAEAAAKFREALAIKPDYAQAVNSLGACLHLQGDAAAAMEHYRRAIDIDPRLATAYNNLGMALFQQGKLEEAAQQYWLLIQVDPRSVDAYHALAVIQRRRGKPAEALALCREAVAAAPHSAAAYYLLGQCCDAVQQTAQAADAYRAAIRLDPDHVQALNNLATILATASDAAHRNGDEALRLSRRACELTANNEPRLLGTLADAHAEAGQFTEAIAVAEKALTLARTKRQEGLAAALEQRLSLFKAGQAARER